jgi:hypothetical protein
MIMPAGTLLTKPVGPAIGALMFDQTRDTFVKWSGTSWMPIRDSAAVEESLRLQHPGLQELYEQHITAKEKYETMLALVREA